jgi:hypothetical protein
MESFWPSTQIELLDRKKWKTTAAAAVNRKPDRR